MARKVKGGRTPEQLAADPVVMELRGRQADIAAARAAANEDFRRQWAERMKRADPPPPHMISTLHAHDRRCAVLILQTTRYAPDKNEKPTIPVAGVVRLGCERNPGMPVRMIRGVVDGAEWQAILAAGVHNQALIAEAYGS